MANKVKYGLKNVYYAKATISDVDGSATYSTPVQWPGAVNLSLDAEGGTTKFRADNIDYWIGQSNNGYSGDFESALIPDSFKKDILGEVEDANGILTEDADAKTNYFALMFQFEGDEKNTRHVLYKCSATRPSVTGQTTDEEIEPQTETLTITATSVYNASLGKNLVKARCLESNNAYSGWFGSVYQATGTATVYYTVAFESNGGSAVPSQTVVSGAKATEPDDPTKEGYTFSAWYTEAALTNVYDFDTAVTAHTILYAKWVSA